MKNSQTSVILEKILDFLKSFMLQLGDLQIYFMTFHETIPLFEDLSGMRKACQLAASVLDYIEPFVQVGVSTQKLDQLCYDFILQNGAIPAPLGYQGYPKSICTSLNHVVCHGIPSDDTRLQPGDSLNIDVSVILDGWYGDTGRMFLLPPIHPQAILLSEVTYQALWEGIKAVRAGAHLGDIGWAISQVARDHNFSVVKAFCGHGIGRVFHGPPQVMHTGKAGHGMILKEGMCFTIEPMINAGRAEVKILSDGWTAVTKDNSLSAQWEHTLAVTAEGAEVLTLSEREKSNTFLAPFQAS